MKKNRAYSNFCRGSGLSLPSMDVSAWARRIDLLAFNRGGEDLGDASFSSSSGSAGHSRV